MAPSKGEKTRKRRRKARTEVSSSSDSSSESEKSAQSPADKQPPPTDQIKSTSSSRASSEVDGPASPARVQKQAPKDPERSFEDFYLKQATKEFANDIDKLRIAPDFNERNVPILIRALRQGTACFGEKERRRVGGAGQ